MLLRIWKLKKTQNGGFDAATRLQYGVLSGTVGILLNLLLFAGKLIAALASGSVAVMADAFNNLSDAGSSIVTLIGFKLSGKDPDPQHPFGRGRLEYISGFVISVFIIVMGFELARDSLVGIGSPQTVTYSTMIVIILIASICVKLYMALYNTLLSKLFESPTMKATARDSLADVCSTGAVLAALLISHSTGIDLDRYMGLVVSLLILYSGVVSARDTLMPLLGTPPSPELVDEIKQIVMAHRPVISGMHDLVVHNYGPGRFMISLHAEIPANIGVFDAHCIIDDLENELGKKLNCEAVIHFDPVDHDDEQLMYLRSVVEDVVREIDERITIHDFRYVPGPTHTNLLFDIVVPYKFCECDDDLKKRIAGEVEKRMPQHHCVIKCDKSYIV